MEEGRLEKFELDGSFGWGFCFFADEANGIAKLFIGDAQDGDFAFIGDEFADAFDMGGGGFEGGAVANVDRVLVHLETVLEEVFTEACGGFALGFRIGGQIEHDVDPHKRIGREGELGGLLFHLLNAGSERVEVSPL